MGTHLRNALLSDCDVLWINDPTLGVHCCTGEIPALYDVTDDWRTFSFPPRIKRRIIRAESTLACRCLTVVCSDILRERWQERYGVKPPVVHNGVDVAAWRDASPHVLAGNAPHVGYIGTLHQDRLDLAILKSLSEDGRIGHIHLVGPDALNEESREQLVGLPRLTLHGAVAASEVPSWTRAMDVLISPHQVTSFTLSLDAIKSYEYLASGRPVVATPTSGFQRLRSPQLTLADRARFVEAVVASTEKPATSNVDLSTISWEHRARDFRQLLDAAITGPLGSSDRTFSQPRIRRSQ